LLEWPKFQKEIQSYDPLIILIENSSLEKNHLLDFRKITFFGSENWKNRLKNVI
jgi:hypothetical protein